MFLQTDDGVALGVHSQINESLQSFDDPRQGDLDAVELEVYVICHLLLLLDEGIQILSKTQYFTSHLKLLL